MSDQVRLQELIDVVAMLPEEEDHIARPVSGRDLRILVREIERLRDLADEMNNELFSEKMTIDGLKWQLQQAEKKIEQLEIKLNSIRFYVENPVPEDKLAETILHIINDPEHDGI